MATPGQDRVERRLAAILAADVAGYGRLSGVDEEGTLARTSSRFHRRRARSRLKRHSGIKMSRKIGDARLMRLRRAAWVQRRRDNLFNDRSR
jgi:class 3 adenylate cyclase